jgi:hypothetical protein
MVACTSDAGKSSRFEPTGGKFDLLAVRGFLFLCPTQSETTLYNKLAAPPCPVDIEPALDELLLASDDPIRFSAALRKLPGLLSDAATRCPFGCTGGLPELLEHNSNLLLGAIILSNFSIFLYHK